MCWQKTDFVDFCLTQWWSRLGFAGIPRISLSQDWRTQAQKSVGTNDVLTLHDGASSRIGSRLFSQINRLIHPILHLSFIIKQTRDRTFKKTFQLVRVAQITAERQEKQKWELGVQTTSTRKKSYVLSIHCQSKSGMVEPWNRREGGHSISLMKAPMESVSRSPQEVQKPHSQSQLSSWCARMILCNVESHRVNISWSIQTQNLPRNMNHNVNKINIIFCQIQKRKVHFGSRKCIRSKTILYTFAP